MARKSEGETAVLINCKRMYLFLPSNGPLKSILTRSQGCKAFINCLGAFEKNFGLSFAQVLHVSQTFFTSSVQNGRFLDLTK